MKTIEIEAILPDAPGLLSLKGPSEAEGYRFVARLLADARSGDNRFDRPGEVFLGAFADGRLVGCGGLNVDPYATASIGRVRHVYVAAEARRRGVASRLVQRLLDRGFKHFPEIRLRVSDARAASFYEAIGFQKIENRAATHTLRRP